MYSAEELKSLHGFIRSTGEGNLKKMMVGGRMTEVHLRMLIKIARGCNEADFVTHFGVGTFPGFPQVKFAPAETAIKETCYGVFAEACTKLGLISAAQKAA